MTLDVIAAWLLILSSVAAGFVHWRYRRKILTAVRWGLIAFALQIGLAFGFTGLWQKLIEQSAMSDIFQYTIPVSVACFWLFAWRKSAGS